MSTITKKELAALVSQRSGCPQTLSLEVVDQLFVAMRESLIANHRIEIRGFGALRVKDTLPKPGARNPRTGETIYVPARRKTLFRAGQLLKKGLHKQPEKRELHTGEATDTTDSA